MLRRWLAIGLALAIAACSTPASADSGPVARGAFGIGGVFIPINGGIFGGAAHAGAVFPRGSWDVRALVTGYQADDPNTRARGVFVHVHATHWLAERYGYAFSAGSGYVHFTNLGDGWSGNDVTLGGYVSPFVYRLFPSLEMAGQLGVFEYPHFDIKPFVFVSLTALLG